jgi:hypothetical protein
MSISFFINFFTLQCVRQLRRATDKRVRWRGIPDQTSGPQLGVSDFKRA